MAYLHCHTPGCEWSQDDFHTKNYNLFTKTKSRFKWLGKPKMIGWDSWFVAHEAVELQDYTHIKVWFNKKNECFSWNWLLLELVSNLKAQRNMKWKTYKAYQKALEKGTAVCPRCGKVCWDID